MIEVVMTAYGTDEAPSEIIYRILEFQEKIKKLETMFKNKD